MGNKVKKNPYSDKYYHRHFTKYRNWENKIGEYIHTDLSPDSVLDLGCAVGSYLEGFYNSGCVDLLGIELNYDNAKKYIVENIKPYIVQNDATKKLNLYRLFDCVISFEVGEHIDPKGTEQFIENLTFYSKRYIVFTAAREKQRGTGHINLISRENWIKFITDKNFIYRKDKVNEYISVFKELGAPKYILKNLMFFERKQL